MSKYYQFRLGEQDFVFDGNSFRIFRVDKRIESRDLGNVPLRNIVPFLRTLALTITNNCNLYCSCCYANQGRWDLPGLVMDVATAFRSVDLLIDSVCANHGDFMTVSFFGGEPLMQFDLIKEIVSYTEKKTPKNIAVRFATVTNGTLLTKEKADYMKSKRFVLSLSVDGPESMHDGCRKFRSGGESYDLLEKNLPNVFPEMPVLARMTISDHNYEVDKAVKHVHSLGIKRIVYELDHGINEVNLEKFFTSSKYLFAFYLDCIKRGDYFDFRNITRILASVLLKRTSKSHCNAGVGYMCVSADGILYPCHRFIGQEAFRLGNVHDLDQKSIQGMVDTFNTSLMDSAGQRNAECLNCPFTLLCGGMCYYHAFVETGNIFQIVKRDCLLKQMTFDQTLKFICSMPVGGLQKFVSFLTDMWKEEDRKGSDFAE